MKKIKFLMMALLISLSAFAGKADNDTIPATQKDVSRWISEPYITSKGKESVHYYAVYRGELINTTKTTIEKVQLCNKYGAHCALIVIGRRVNNTFKPKRIIAN